MKPRVRRDVVRIAQQFELMRDFCAAADRHSSRISGWSVGQHVDHLIKADQSIFVRFPAPEEEAPPQVTPLGRFVLWTGWIPRGKGKAPSATQPEAPERDALIEGIDGIERLFEQAIELPEALADPAPIAKHPYFGGLNRAQWLRFVQVHHHHHAKIVRDILRAS